MDGKGEDTQGKEVKGSGNVVSDDGWVQKGAWRARAVKAGSRDSATSLRRSRIEWLSSTGSSKTSTSPQSVLQPLAAPNIQATTLRARMEPVFNRTTSTKWLHSISDTEPLGAQSESKLSAIPEEETSPSTLSSSTSSHKQPQLFPQICDKCGHSLTQEEDSPTASEASDSDTT